MLRVRNVEGFNFVPYLPTSPKYSTNKTADLVVLVVEPGVVRHWEGGGDQAHGNLGPQDLRPTLSLFCRNASTDNGSNILCTQLAQESAQCCHGLQQNGWPRTVGSGCYGRLHKKQTYYIVIR
jgi:hypothetical protein